MNNVVRFGWFTDDFTLTEVQTLTAKERMRVVRSANKTFDGQYRVPTLAEVVDLAARSRTGSGQPLGLFTKKKHSTHFRALGLTLEAELVQVLAERGYDRAGSPVFLESSETGNHKRLAQLTDHKSSSWSGGRADPPTSEQQAIRGPTVTSSPAAGWARYAATPLPSAWSRTSPSPVTTTTSSCSPARSSRTPTDTA